MATTKKTLLQKITAFLNITDEGKINHFLQKQVKSLNREITAAKKNIETLQFNYNNRIELLNEQLEDARNEVDTAYMSITLDDIKTNADQDQFALRYWDSIEIAERKVKNIEDSIKDLQESHDKEIENLQKHIDEANRRISIIS